MKIYTKTGDDGSTGLFGGTRVGKDDVLVEAYGTVDELNCVLGMCRAAGSNDELDALLHQFQDDLFCLGAEVACAPEQRSRLASRALSEPDIQRLEQAIDQYEATLPALKNFVLPGGSPGAAALHLARAVCRRAERRVLAAGRTLPLRPEILIYLNRLSDLLFVLARAANQLAGRPDLLWAPRGQH